MNLTAEKAIHFTIDVSCLILIVYTLGMDDEQLQKILKKHEKERASLVETQEEEKIKQMENFKVNFQHLPPFPSPVNFDPELHSVHSGL